MADKEVGKRLARLVEGVTGGAVVDDPQLRALRAQARAQGDGRLRVLDECGATHRLDAADIVHLRPLDKG